MIAENDILMIKTFFEQAGNEALNVAFFKVEGVAGVPPTVAQFARWYHESYAPQIVSNFLHGSANYVRTVVEYIDGSMDFGDYSNVISGSVGGEPAPSFTAIDVKQNVGNRLTRAGRKRLPFISESASNGNSITLAGVVVTVIETWFGISALVVDPLDATNAVSLSPVIVGRTETPPGSGVYVLDPAKVNPVTSAELIQVTTQNSRKP